MTAIEFIYHLGVIPLSVEKPCTVPSRGEVKRWLDQGAVEVDGAKPRANAEISLPVRSLVFFPRSPRRTTVL